MAAVRPSAGDGYQYMTDSFLQCWEVSRDPYNITTDAEAPMTPEESALIHGLAQTMPQMSDCATVPWLDASRWILRQDSFDVRFDMDSVLEDHGPGIYSVVLWADVGGETEAVGEHLIFHETEQPQEYNP